MLYLCFICLGLAVTLEVGTRTAHFTDGKWKLRPKATCGEKEGRRGGESPAGRPQGGRVAAAREWEGRQDSLGQGDGPAFQELAQILTEATTLLCCPNHTSSFFLAARLPGAWQAPRFLGWNLGWGQGGWGLGGRR